MASLLRASSQNPSAIRDITGSGSRYRVQELFPLLLFLLLSAQLEVLNPVKTHEGWKQTPGGCSEMKGDRFRW